jgi:histidinol-phosphate aminotransferase
VETKRRIWLKQVAMIAADAVLAPLVSLAEPVRRVGVVPVADNGPVRLSSNENPFGPSPAAREAMRASINSSNRYQWKKLNDLKDAIAKKNGVSSDQVLLGAGSTQIIDTCIQFAGQQKGSFVLPDPTFGRWAPAAEKCGLKKTPVALTHDKKHDLQAMLSAVGPGTRMVYVCNPNNPTGTVCSRGALEAFVQEAGKRTLVVVDEAYLEYSGERSLSDLVATNERLIVVKTFSKIYGLAGARIGYALAHSKTIEGMEQLQSGANIAVSAVSMAGARASLGDSDFVSQAAADNEKARAYTITQLEKLGIPCITSHTNFIYFSLAGYKRDFFGLLKAAQIEGTDIFEQDGRWSRITVGTMEEMKKFVGAIA